MEEEKYMTKIFKLEINLPCSKLEFLIQELPVSLNRVSNQINEIFGKTGTDNMLNYAQHFGRDVGHTFPNAITVRITDVIEGSVYVEERMRIEDEMSPLNLREKFEDLLCSLWATLNVDLHR